VSKKLSEKIEMFVGGNLEGIFQVSALNRWTLPNAWTLVFLLGILGGSIALIAVGIPIAPGSGCGTRSRKARLSAAARVNTDRVT
jgi:hypothetical protein